MHNKMQLDGFAPMCSLVDRLPLSSHEKVRVAASNKHNKHNAAWQVAFLAIPWPIGGIRVP